MRTLHRAPLRLRAIGARARSSETRLSHDGSTPDWTAFWQGEGVTPQYPPHSAGHPNPNIKLNKTAFEWKIHHQHGLRYGMYGPTREIADWEYADGTPAPISRKRYATQHHLDHLLVQIVRAGAEVEQRLARDEMPRIPGTKEQRDWDPEIPLFLDDVDEHGRPPRPGDHEDRHIDAVYAAKSGERHPEVKPAVGETLEPIALFASYEPHDFVDDTVTLSEDRRPIWSRRKWALTNEFLLPKKKHNKNAIQDT